MDTSAKLVGAYLPDAYILRNGERVNAVRLICLIFTLVQYVFQCKYNCWFQLKGQADYTNCTVSWESLQLHLMWKLLRMCPCLWFNMCMFIIRFCFNIYNYSSSVNTMLVIYSHYSSFSFPFLPRIAFNFPWCCKIKKKRKKKNFIPQRMCVFFCCCTVVVFFLIFLFLIPLIMLQPLF